MESAASADVLRSGPWRATRSSGELAGPGGAQRLEPKVMDLLFLLAGRGGEVVPREAIMAALWPGVIVGEDTLARTLSKLRTALGDDARAPRFVETIAKRGCRWLAPVEFGDVTSASVSVAAPPPPSDPARSRGPRREGQVVGAAAALLLTIAITVFVAWPDRPPPPDGPTVAEPAERDWLARADDAYFQFSRADNEAAIELYQRVLSRSPDDPAALAGLANALVQRALRWPQVPGSDRTEFQRLEDALANGHLSREPQRAQLIRAQLLAERAVERAPRSAAAFKALGFVASAQSRFDDALAAYERAIALDPDAWGAMINTGDVLGIVGRNAEALTWFERAFAAMQRAYAHSPAQVRPWLAPLGVLIAERHEARGDRAAAEGWYRRVLDQVPLHAGATRGLAAVLRTGGDPEGAGQLCAALEQRTAQRCE